MSPSSATELPAVTSLPPSVTVIGLGPMGQAMVHALLTAGHPVTVWNRTPERADALVAAGAQRAATPADALAASELTILSLTDYDAMWAVLEPATASLSGRVLANLSSDTPDKTRAAAEWAATHGASFISGGVMVPEMMVGTDAAYVYYSGGEEAFGEHRDTLARIGEPRFLGPDPGSAQLMYQANLDVFLTALAGIMHATAMAGAAGISAQTFLSEVMQLVTGIPDMMASDGIEALGARIDAGEHPGEGATSLMMGATADHIVATAATVGIDTRLPQAVQHLYHRVLEDGHGADGWTRTIDAVRHPVASVTG
ncbi:MAG TPA: NAD(P)-binding domain-containing protein [Candidatus Ruania gallistercoris]|uniref:NAD(P)-binding domain-containing protein n=1 Tax=Candidatus Ruania gallistercoris TaxID=2838746 RepID=A0A9D2J649_9MICO|nr:NAD(P)-binding domain-containing protein [Candidatus Ruania gallistercoris]